MCLYLFHCSLSSSLSGSGPGLSMWQSDDIANDATAFDQSSSVPSLAPSCHTKQHFVSASPLPSPSSESLFSKMGSFGSDALSAASTKGLQGYTTTSSFFLFVFVLLTSGCFVISHSRFVLFNVSRFVIYWLVTKLKPIVDANIFLLVSQPNHLSLSIFTPQLQKFSRIKRMFQ